MNRTFARTAADGGISSVLARIHCTDERLVHPPRGIRFACVADSLILLAQVISGRRGIESSHRQSTLCGHLLSPYPERQLHHQYRSLYRIRVVSPHVCHERFNHPAPNTHRVFCALPVSIDSVPFGFNFDDSSNFESGFDVIRGPQKPLLDFPDFMLIFLRLPYGCVVRHTSVVAKQKALASTSCAQPPGLRTRKISFASFRLQRAQQIKMSKGLFVFSCSIRRGRLILPWV